VTNDHQAALLRLRAKFPVGATHRDGGLNILPAAEEVRRYLTACGETRALVLVWHDEHQCMEALDDVEIILPFGAERAGCIEVSTKHEHLRWKVTAATVAPPALPLPTSAFDASTFSTHPGLAPRKLVPVPTLYVRRS